MKLLDVNPRSCYIVWRPLLREIAVHANRYSQDESSCSSGLLNERWNTTPLSACQFFTFPND